MCLPYIDPEILDTGYASKKSDQRALAVIVCELLSGKREKELGDIIHKVESGKCPQELRYVSEKVRDVIFRAIARSPKDRFPSVGTFASAFVAACAENGVPIGEHVLPMMQEVKKHVEAETNNLYLCGLVAESVQATRDAKRSSADMPEKAC